MISRLLPACLLAGLCETGSAEMAVQSSYPATVPHLTGTLAYPQDVLGMQRAEGWWFGGATNGNGGGIRRVPAPGRPGQQALEFSFSINRAAPQWLEWRYALTPQLSVFGSRELVFELYPVDDLTMDIQARFGTQQGQSVLPICWSSLGKHPAGKWVTVRLPIMTQRYIDTLKFDLDNQAEGIPNGQPVRFILANFRFEPAPRETAELPIASLKTRPPMQAGYLELTQGAMVKDAQPLQLHLELSATTSQTATLRVLKWQQRIELKAPCTVLDITIPNVVDVLGMGRFPLEVELTGAGGQRLAWLATPTPIATFSTTAMERQRQDLIRLRNQLQAKADRRPGNEEVLVSLTVARVFLETYIPDDFNRQGAFAIAMRELADVGAILGQTEQALAQPPTHTAPLADYDPTQPVVIRDGNFTQKGRPLLFVGPLAWTGMPDAIELACGLGFNSVVMDLGLPGWYGGNRAGAAAAQAALDQSQRAGIAISFQLASHYVPTLTPTDAAAIGDGASGNPGLPWNILRPETHRVVGSWYDAMLPAFTAYPNLLNLGTANEPTYGVSPDSQSFQTAFRKWAAGQYRNIAAANARWDSHYPSFAAIDLPGFFAFRKHSKGADYDWNQFEGQTQGDFFAFLCGRVHRYLPHASVSAKLAGGYGYDYLDEQEILWRGGQTVHGTDGTAPMFLDYLKSLDPTLPVFDGEWHMIFSEQMGNSPAYLSRNMFQGVVHGIGAGYIWQWSRFDWNSQTHGAIGSITRYPLGLDAMGRTTVKLRRLMPVIARFANLDGGRVRLLYSKASHLHQPVAEERVLPGVQLLVKVPAYLKDLENTYDHLSTNSSGVRFVIPETLTAKALARVSLVATGSADYLQTPALAAIETWVAQGGTLWLTTPGLLADPWGKPHHGIAPTFLALLAAPGEHPYKNGRVVVDGKWTGFQAYLDGPRVTTADGKAVSRIECRAAASPDGKTRYLYLYNAGDQDQTVRLTPAPKGVGRDLWNGGNLDLAQPVRLPANGVLLMEYQ